MAPETLSRKELRKAKKAGQSNNSTTTDHHATAFEGPSQPLDVSADPVRESSSGGQARSSTVPSSSLATTSAQPSTLQSMTRAQPLRTSTHSNGKTEDLGQNPVQGSAEGSAGAPAQALAPSPRIGVDWGGDVYPTVATVSFPHHEWHFGHGAKSLILNSEVVSRIQL